MRTAVCRACFLKPHDFLPNFKWFQLFGSAFGLTRKSPKVEDKTTTDDRDRSQNSVATFLNAREVARELIVDSGASYHLVAEKSLLPSELATKRRVLNPIIIHAATGPVTTEFEADVYVHVLGRTVTAFIMPGDASALSMGQLVEDRYDFHWYHPHW